jgi:hypothetical protein
MIKKIDFCFISNKSEIKTTIPGGKGGSQRHLPSLGLLGHHFFLPIFAPVLAFSIFFRKDSDILDGLGTN